MTDVQNKNSGASEATVSITVDGKAVNARPGDLIIEAAERAGVFIPRFCYHPRMEPVGMCRMCLVEVSGPRGFSLQPACYLRVNEGLEVLTQSDKARKAQEGVIEFLLVNHPLDCPVCDKGGECPLQDQSLSHGPGESRFVEEKRHWAKPIEIGHFVAAPDSLTRSPAMPRSTSRLVGIAPRSRPSRRALSTPTSRETRSRSVRSGRLLHRPTVSRLVRGISNKSSRRARRVRWVADTWRNLLPASSCGSWVSIPIPSTRAGCVTRVGSVSVRSTASTASPSRC